MVTNAGLVSAWRWRVAAATIRIEDVGDLGFQIARATMKAWEERERAACERIYTWKCIAAEVEKQKGVPVSVKTLRRWWRTRRFPIDTDKIGVSVTRHELERWLRARTHLP